MEGVVLNNDSSSVNPSLHQMVIQSGGERRDQDNPFAPLFTRPEAQGLYYNGKIVQLDGYRFVGCRFDNCILKIASDNFELIKCVIDNTTRIEYSHGLAKVIKLFLGRYPWAYEYFPNFTPIKNQDGSETISDWRL